MQSFEVFAGLNRHYCRQGKKGAVCVPMDLEKYNMEINKKDLQQLLRRYLNNECTTSEMRQIEQWYMRIAQNKLELDDSEQIEIKNRILQKIQQAQFKRKSESFQHIPRWLAIAAAVSLFILIGYQVMFKKSSDESLALTELTGREVVTYENKLTEDQRITLPDQSIVLLGQGSKIQFERDFTNQKREVWLTGKAFFDVVKNNDRPFYVYGSAVVTHVLGTSFMVNAQPNSKTIEVEVKTGKVSVYGQYAGDSEKQKTNGVILMPNQKVVYHLAEDHWVTGLVDVPVIVNTPKQKSNLVFEDTPITEIIRLLSDDYKIEIVMESETSSQCTFTGDVSGMRLYDAINVITRSMGGNYEIRGTKILLTEMKCN